jgi:hypothetical protein
MTEGGADHQFVIRPCSPREGGGDSRRPAARKLFIARRDGPMVVLDRRIDGLFVSKGMLWRMSTDERKGMIRLKFLSSLDERSVWYEWMTFEDSELQCHHLETRILQIPEAIILQVRTSEADGIEVALHSDARVEICNTWGQGVLRNMAHRTRVHDDVLGSGTIVGYQDGVNLVHLDREWPDCLATLHMGYPTLMRPIENLFARSFTLDGGWTLESFGFFRM